MGNQSQWAKDVKKSLIDRGWTMTDLGEKVGYSVQTVHAVVNGRYPNATGNAIVGMINSALGTQGGPARLVTEEWQTSVRVAMLEKHLTVTELAERLGISRDKLSQIINGRQWDGDTIGKVVELLGVRPPSAPYAN